jgi:hypothetical protein
MFILEPKGKRRMIVIVCGGRAYHDRGHVMDVLDWLRDEHPELEIIHGGATGADALAAEWAEARKVKATAFPADWKAHGRAAGPIRNRQMLAKLMAHGVERNCAIGVVAFPGGAGTTDMVVTAQKARVKVWDLRAPDSILTIDRP